MTKLETPLLDQIMEFAEQREISLPVFNDVAMQVQAAARSDTFNMATIERAIDSDEALATEVLRVANSAFFGGLAEVRTVSKAALRLGLSRIANIVMLATEKNRYQARSPEIAALLQTLWRHSSACALAADWIADRARYSHVSGEAFVGGLIHDIGQLFVLRVLDEMLAENQADPAYPPELISEVLSQAHAEVGAQLLRTWRIPDVYVVIVRDHHAPAPDPLNIPLAIVRLADHACNKLGLGLESNPSIVLSACVESQILGLSEITLAELEILLEDSAALNI